MSARWHLQLCIIGALLLQGCATTAPADLWRNTGTFAACPPRPNCVSSVASDSDHAIAPLRYSGTAAAARERLIAALAAMPRNRIEYATPEYLHVVFVSRLLRFRDDVEFLIGDGVIQVRSRSWIGYSDLGVNRARVERLRALFEQGGG